MGNQDNKKMGYDPLAWINADAEEKEDNSKRGIKENMGRPRTIYREYEKSSQEGLQENFIRATFIVREDLLQKLKDYAYTERCSIKDIVNEMITSYLNGKDIIGRGE